jgi:glutamate--cysteine ligase
MVDNNQTRADEMLEKFHGEWNGDITRLYKEYAF